MTTQQLKQKLHEQKNKMGLVGGSLNIKEYDEAKNNVSAHITPEGWNIEIALRKGFNPVSDRRQTAYARRKGIKDGLETLLGGVLSHEIGHWELPLGSERGCPYDVYNHDKILEAVRIALPDDKKGHAGYVANAFEDLIVNARGREFQGNLSGQVLFWDNEGLSLNEKGQKGYTPFYEAFVKLNMHLAGEKSDVALLKRHYTGKKPIDQAVQKVINEINLPKDIANTNLGTSPLFARPDWPTMASTFTRHLAPLLEQAPTERLSAYGSGEGNGSGKEEESKPGNGIEQKMRTPDGKEEIAYGRYSGNEVLSTNITSFDQLDSLYKKLAKDISVKVDSMTRSQSLPVATLTYRPFDEDKDDPVRVKASRLRLTDNGLTFSYPNQPLVINSKFKMQKKSFPDFKMVVLDSSGSMEEGIDGNEGSKTFIPWGDNSKYHFALLGFYGIENFLQRQGIAQYITHGVSLFSDSTRYRESDFSGIAEVRKLALSPQFGNTRLDAKVLTQALKGRESLVLSLSDGEIGNWDSEKAEFEKLAANNLYAHIHLGGDTQFTNDLKSWGLPVFYVNSGKDLSHLMVDITKKQYERFTKQ